MTDREQMRKYATEIADFLRRNKATLADTARHFGITDYAAKCRAERAMNMGLLDKNYFKRHMPSCKTQVWAWEMADYLMFHENASISDAAGYFNCGYGYANDNLQEAITLGFLEARVYQERKHISQKNRTLENEKEVVGLRRQNLTFEEIGKELGRTREWARQLLKSAAEDGIADEKELEMLKHPHAKRKQWAYFLELTSRIEDINSQSYAALAGRHYPSAKNHSIHSEVEHKCLNELVKHADPEDPDRFTRKDAKAVRLVLKTLKMSALSLSELRKMFNEYINTGISQKNLAIKYGIANDTNPASVACRYLRRAIELGIAGDEDCKAYAAKTESIMNETWQRMGRQARKYPEEKLNLAITLHEQTGLPLKEIARAVGVSPYAVYHANNAPKNRQDAGKS